MKRPRIALRALGLMVLGACALLSPAMMYGAAAQNQLQPAFGQEPAFESPLYTPGQSTLDKTFGLPTLAMPGQDMPRQQTMEPTVRTPAQPDFFQAPTAGGMLPDASNAVPADPQRPDFFAVPAAREPLPSEVIAADQMPRSYGSTPIYTTTQGMTTLLRRPPPANNGPATSETSLFSTDPSGTGMTTGDLGSTYTTR